jgi:hypothetical protein
MKGRSRDLQHLAPQDLRLDVCGVEVVNPDEAGGDLFEVPISPEMLDELHDLAYVP